MKQLKSYKQVEGVKAAPKNPVDRSIHAVRFTGKRLSAEATRVRDQLIQKVAQDYPHFKAWEIAYVIGVSESTVKRVKRLNK